MHHRLARYTRIRWIRMEIGRARSISQPMDLRRGYRRLPITSRLVGARQSTTRNGGFNRLQSDNVARVFVALAREKFREFFGFS